MVTNVSPSITASPLFTLILVMVPEVSASILFCIFMASRMTTVSPAFTLSPTFTLISLILPGRGATTGLPAAAVGAELVLAAEAEELLDSSLFTLRSSLPSALRSSLSFTFCLPVSAVPFRLPRWRQPLWLQQPRVRRQGRRGSYYC